MTVEQDDILDALDQQQPAPTPGGGANYDGRIAVNPRTGQRLVYRMNPTGHGRFVALSADTAAPAARERVDALTNRWQQGVRTLNHARQFIDLNANAETGGMQNDPNLPEFVRPPNAQRFQQLSRQMVADNWQPGTSGMMNTATEMNVMAGRYPSPTNKGPVNRDAYLQIQEDVGVQEAALRDMRAWLQEHPTLDNWDQHWAQMETRIRPQIRARAVRDFNQQWRELHNQTQTQPNLRNANRGGPLPMTTPPPPQGIAPDEWAHMTPQERQRVQQLTGARR